MASAATLSPCVNSSNHSSAPVANSSSLLAAFKAKIKNEQEFLEEGFSELLDAGLNLITAPFDEPDQAHAATSQLRNILTADGVSNITNLKEYLAAKGIKNPRILSIIDLQKDFLNGGSLMVPGAEEKVFAALKELLEENKQRIAQGQEPLFDVIVMTKDLHPEGHKSFTGSFFDLKEKTFAEGKGFELTLNEKGRASGAAIRDLWKNIPPFKDHFKFPDTKDPHTIALVPQDGAKYASLKTQLKEGKLMPFTMGLHPIPATAHMFRNVKGMSQNETFDLLKKASLLVSVGSGHNATRNVIRPDFVAGGVELRNAFSSDPKNSFAGPVFNPAFTKGFAEALFKKTDQASIATATEILQALLENFWPDHCVQGDPGNQFHEELVALLKENAADVPLLPLPKGTSHNLGESYSGGLNTAGYLATPYIPLLKFLEAKENIVCGTATGFCPSGCAFDSAASGIKTIYWTGASKGITTGEEETTHKQLAFTEIEVTDAFPGLARPVDSADVQLDKAFFAPVQPNQDYQVTTRNKGKYTLSILPGTDALSLSKAEEAARCLRTFLTSDLSKTYYTPSQKANLVGHVTAINDVIEKYNDSVNNSGFITFLTVVLLILTIGIYNLRRDSLIRPTISNLLPADFKDAVSIVAFRKERADVITNRRQAFTLLDGRFRGRQPLEDAEVALMAKLHAIHTVPYKESMQKTAPRVEAFQQNKLDTIKSVQVVLRRDGQQYGSANLSLFDIDKAIEAVGENPDIAIEAILADKSKVRFGVPAAGSHDLPLGLLQFASEVAIDAACAKVILKYKELADVLATRQQAVQILEQGCATELEGNLLNRLRLGLPVVPETPVLAKAYVTLGLQGVKLLSIVERSSGSIGSFAGGEASLLYLERLIESIDESQLVEATIGPNDTKVRFGIAPGDHPLEQLRFAADKAINAACAKVIADHAKNAATAAVAKKE